eukprot:4808982-Prymnesium_polylepis.1
MLNIEPLEDTHARYRVCAQNRSRWPRAGWEGRQPRAHENSERLSRCLGPTLKRRKNNGQFRVQSFSPKETLNLGFLK